MKVSHSAVSTTIESPWIYKRDSKGDIRVWSYEVDGDKWRVHHGQKDGVITTTGWTYCVPKSHSTAEAQAYFEAQAEMAKKLARDYRESIADVDVPRASVIRPMLAHKYEGWSGECYSQPKLDGIRCIATRDGLWTRQGKPIVSVPHIVEALSPLFSRIPSLIFDGELYNHDMKDDFNAIVSLVRKTKPSEDDLAESARLVQYHIYDLPSEWGEFMNRHRELIRLFRDDDGLVPACLQPVETSLCLNGEMLDTLYASYIEDGYEGQMVRSNGLYEQKRSKHLLKRKEFQDAEFRLLRIEEGLGNWGSYAKRAVFALDDGREFGSGIKGNQDFCRHLLGNPEGFTHGTVRYFALTPDGIPRFPVAVDFFKGDRG